MVSYSILLQGKKSREVERGADKEANEKTDGQKSGKGRTEQQKEHEISEGASVVMKRGGERRGGQVERGNSKREAGMEAEEDEEVGRGSGCHSRWGEERPEVTGSTTTESHSPAAQRSAPPPLVRSSPTAQLAGGRSQSASAPVSNMPSKPAKRHQGPLPDILAPHSLGRHLVRRGKQVTMRRPPMRHGLHSFQATAHMHVGSPLASDLPAELALLSELIGSLPRRQQSSFLIAETS
ncbi:hypothetical protein ANO11243_058330 [Dothideomycetidae sp. 11243]|nr:hypothetical protein ANO11243_058330 [fungal sp. No.11243]